MGIEIPEVPRPLGAYVEAVQSGNLLFLTGAMPTVSGKPKFAGKLGVDDQEVVPQSERLMGGL